MLHRCLLLLLRIRYSDGDCNFKREAIVHYQACLTISFKIMGIQQLHYICNDEHCEEFIDFILTEYNNNNCLIVNIQIKQLVGFGLSSKKSHVVGSKVNPLPPYCLPWHFRRQSVAHTTDDCPQHSVLFETMIPSCSPYKFKFTPSSYIYISSSTPLS